MANQNCQDCGKEYDDENVNIPTPIPQNMCFRCGTQLTDAEVSALIASLNNEQNT